jgi:hypothetical protein
MHRTNLLSLALAGLFLGACWRDAPLDPATAAGEDTVELNAEEGLMASADELAGFLAALEDALTRELPGLGSEAAARQIETGLHELTTALATNQRSAATQAVRSARSAVGAYRTAPHDVAAELATLDAIELVLERVETLVSEPRGEPGAASQLHPDIR